MKKMILRLFLLVTLVFFGSGVVMANEGVINLRGTGRMACYASSIYIDGNYRVTMTCRELITAISPEKNRYIVWYEDTAGKVRSASEIQNGKMTTIIRDKFVRLFVTTEENDYPVKPSTDVILNGYVAPIDFGGDSAGGGVILSTITPIVSVTTEVTPTPTKEKVTPTAKVTTVVTPKATGTTSQSGLGSALSTIFKVALFGFGLLLVVVGVFSFLQRRRSL